MRKVSVKWKNWTDFRVPHSTQFRGENWSKIEILSSNSLSKIQELQNEINCMKDSRDFQDSESVRYGQSHVTSQPVFFPPHPDLGGMPSRSLGMPSRNNGPPSIWDTYGISGKRLCKSKRRLIQHLIRRNWIHGALMCQNTHVMSECQTPIQDQRCQSRPSAQKFSRPWWGRIFKELWVRPRTTADLRSSFRQIPYTSHVRLLEDEIQDWGLYVFTISYGSYVVDQRSGDDSLDELMSSSSIRRIQMPDFEVPCASANCLWIVFLPAGIIITLTGVVLPGIIRPFDQGSREGLCHFFNRLSNFMIVVHPELRFELFYGVRWGGGG